MAQEHCEAPVQAWSDGGGPLSESGRALQGLQLEKKKKERKMEDTGYVLVLSGPYLRKNLGMPSFLYWDWEVEQESDIGYPKI